VELSAVTETEIAGFLFMGERGGKRYYCSNDKVNWDGAIAGAVSIGGHLVSINDPAENAFITSFLNGQKAYIGLTDFKQNNEAVSYTNWQPFQPNNQNGKQNFTQILPNGTWNDTNRGDLLEYIVEIDCSSVQQIGGPLNGSSFPVGTSTVTYKMTGCDDAETCSFNVTVNPSMTLHVLEDVHFTCEGTANGTKRNIVWTNPYATSCCDNCEEEIEGFVFMGRYKGHSYYCSKDKATWQTAQAIAQQKGGYLAVITDEGENDLLASFLPEQSAYIGLTDVAKEKTFKWVNDEPIFYENWNNNNFHKDKDHVQLLNTGKWSEINGKQQLEFIMEIDCIDVQQIGGPARGSVFPVGTTEITFQATDACGNTQTESFNVTIDACSVTPPVTPPKRYCQPN